MLRQRSSLTESQHDRSYRAFRERCSQSGEVKAQKVTIKAEESDGRTGEKSGRSFLCKVRIERRIRSSPSAVPPSVPPCTFSRPAEVSLGVFHSTTSTFAQPSFEHGALLLGARIKGSRYRSSQSEFSKPYMKWRIELYDRWRERRGGRWGWRGSGERPERGSEEENRCADPFDSIQKGGSTIAAVATATSVGYDDEVIPSSLPQEVTSHLDVINTNISGSCGRFRRQRGPTWSSRDGTGNSRWTATRRRRPYQINRRRRPMSSKVPRHDAVINLDVTHCVARVETDKFAFVANSTGMLLTPR